MQSEGPWCIVSQLIRVCSEESKKRADERERKEEEDREGDTAESFSECRMCIPGDNNRVMSWDYSVQMRKRDALRGRNSIFRRSPWERNDGGWDINPTNQTTTALKTDRVLSRYSVHRINPQCVLTNITQLPPHRFVSAGEARPAPATPPFRSPPTGTETTAEASKGAPDAHSNAILKKQNKTTTSLQTNRGACSWDLMLSSEAGMGERRHRSHTIKLVRILWLSLVPQGSESGLRRRAITWEEVHIPVPSQEWENK